MPWWKSGRLDGRDLELQGHLLGDEHATGLEGGVPDEAEVLAVDVDLAAQAHALVAERVERGALELEVDDDGAGDIAWRAVKPISVWAVSRT